MSRTRPPWAEKLRFWLTENMHPLVEKYVGTVHERANDVLRAVEGRIENGTDHLEDAALRVLCLRYGHEPVADQCNKPEHDFCVYCRKPMPGTAHGPQY